MRRLLVILWLVIWAAMMIVTNAFAQATPPPTDPAPLETVTPTSSPKVIPTGEASIGLQVIEATLNGDLGTAITLIWLHFKGWGLLIIIALAVGLFYIWLLTPERNEARASLRRKFPWLPGLGKAITARRDEPAVVTEGVLEPLHPKEKERFVELSLYVPPKGDQKSQTPSEKYRFKDLSEAMAAVDEDTQQFFPAFVLLGEPGAGKTTLLRQYAWAASHALERNPDAPIPLLIKLNSHSGELPVDFLRRRWRPVPSWKSFDEALNAGKLLLLADGLNEMERDLYPQLIGLWKAFLAQYCRPDGNRAIITCRYADYGDGLGVTIPLLVVRPMDKECILEFLEKYTPGLAGVIWEDIEKDRREGRGDLFELAKVPFWLEAMTQVATRDGLPRNRAGLAATLVDRRLNQELSQNPGQRLTNGWEPHLNGLTHLGWQGLLRSQNYNFPRQEALEILTEAGVSNQPTPQEVLDLAKSCGLLEFNGREGKVSFHHQLFQEYFAARRLAEYFSPETSHQMKLRRSVQRRIWQIPWRNWKYSYSSWGRLPRPPRTGWEEATIIAAGILAPDPTALLQVVLRYNPSLAGECVHRAGIKLEQGFRLRTLADLHKQARRPLPLSRPASWGPWHLPARLERCLSQKWRDRYQARLLLSVSARLEAARQIGWFEDDPALAQQILSFPVSDGQALAFIAPEWVSVAAGEFRMGSGVEETRRLKGYRLKPYPDETPGHPVVLSREYAIGRYPVTIGEYRCFMEAGGYTDEAYWHGEDARSWLRGELDFKNSSQYWLYVEQRKNAEAILPDLPDLVASGQWSPDQARNLQTWLAMPLDNLEKRWRELEAEKRNADGRAIQPWLWDEPEYKNPRQPVIGVCWYEARAYAAWLTEALDKAGRLPPGQVVDLPSEAQWEKAARGRDRRLWPWGNAWDLSRCNTLESRIQLPTPVGMYPQGASPYGALDMAGNVWEWCQDWYSSEEYENRQSEVVDPSGPESGTARVVRGGSWNYSRYFARCAYRDGYLPDYFIYNLGFRVVLSPI